MQSTYIDYKCKGCNKEMILLTEDIIKALNQGKYLACVYCGCKKLKKIKETDEFKQLFKNDEKKR